MTALVQFPSQEAYQSCRQVITHYSTSFYWGTRLFPNPKRQNMWAIYCWCRRTDELVDSNPQGQRPTLQLLDQWEYQLEKTFAGHPATPEDAALAYTASQYPLTLEPFRDMVAGMRMDLTQTRYQTFEELLTYCYRVAGTVGVMTSAVMGFVPEQDGTQEAIALGIAMQLTNILRDVGEDARRGRIYIPLEDLERFKYRERDLLNEVLDERWIALMRFQIARNREYYRKAESGIRKLQPDSRWPVWASLLFYRSILDVVEANGYQNFSKRAYVSDLRKLATLPLAWLRSKQ